MPTQPIKSIQHIDFDAHPVKLLLPADLETLQKAHADIYIYIMYMYADIPCTTGFKCPRFHTRQNSAPFKTRWHSHLRRNQRVGIPMEIMR